MHFPWNVGGHPGCLARAESALLFDTKLVLTTHQYELAGRGASNAVIGGAIRSWLGLYWLLYSAIWADVVHFNFGQKFFPFGVQPYKAGERGFKRVVRFLGFFASRIIGEWDLAFLRLCQVRIIVTFQGDDIRIGKYCSRNYDIHFVREVDRQYYDSVSDARKESQIPTWQKYADQIFALNPDLLNQLPPSARFLPYAHVDLNDWRPVTVSNLKPLIVHAPTNRLVKGTRHIEAALNKLRSRGYDFDVEFVEGRTLSEAREIYSRADIIIDQVLAGWYGGFAVEAMALGKPVVAYIRESDLRHIPTGMAQDLPIINATPESLESVLHDLLSGRVNLIEHGKASRKYVEKWHDPEKIAKITTDAYQGKK